MILRFITWQLFIFASLLGPNAFAHEKTCEEELGHKAAHQLVRQCIVMDASSHPPCAEINPCHLIRLAIVSGCFQMNNGLPSGFEPPTNVRKPICTHKLAAASVIDKLITYSPERFNYTCLRVHEAQQRQGLLRPDEFPLIFNVASACPTKDGVSEGPTRIRLGLDGNYFMDGLDGKQLKIGDIYSDDLPGGINAVD